MAPDLLNPTSSFHMIVRQLFSRLVFSLEIESSLSMEIVAFWLWIEGNGHADFLTRIDSFDNSHLRAIASAGKSFIEALHLTSSESNDRSTWGRYFQKEAAEGVTFYLNNVCYEALEDLQVIAEMKGTIYHTSRQGHPEYIKDKEVPMSTKDLLSMIRASYAKNSEEGTSSRSMQSPKSRILQDVKYGTDERQTYHLATLLDTLNIRGNPDDAVRISNMWQQTSVPRDERTLFVTFSNGYPFTKDELYDFFMRHYGDVEEIIIEEPIESRPPLYAHVTFGSQVTLFHVLDGNKRVKFMTGGKHLWARQFVPKRKKVEE